MKRLLLLLFALVVMGPAHAAEVLLKVSSVNPLAGPLERECALPEFLLMDDGRVFFTRLESKVGRLGLFVAELKGDELSAFLARLNLENAHEWMDTYATTQIKDLPTTTIEFTTVDGPRRIQIYGAAYASQMKQLPPGLNRVYTAAAFFSHPAERRFVPQKGTLLVKRLPDRFRKLNSQNVIDWKDKKIDLEKASGLGEFRVLELEGDLLQRAWDFLDGLALPTMAAPRVLISQKKRLYQVAIRPLLPF